MAPLKTYGSKKRNLLTSRGKIKKTNQNARRPLATLQSTNVVRPGKELNKCKTTEKSIFVETSAVCNGNASPYSPSFPGSEEISSIWNQDSTFDKLLQATTKPEPVPSKTSTLGDTGRKLEETPIKCTSPLKGKRYQLRHLRNEKRWKLSKPSSYDCLACSNASTSKSKSCSREEALQITSTPNVIGNSTSTSYPELTPIYPETVRTVDEKTPVVQVLHSPLVNAPECSPTAAPELSPEHPPRAKSSKTSTSFSDVCSPDMFSSAEKDDHAAVARKKFVRLTLEEPQSIISSVENLPQCAEITNNSGENISERLSDSLEVSINSKDKPITEANCDRKYSSEMLGTEPPHLHLCKNSGYASLGDSIIDSDTHSSELMSKTSVTGSDSKKPDCSSKIQISSFDNDKHSHLESFESVHSSTGSKDGISITSNLSGGSLVSESSDSKDDLDSTCLEGDEESADSLGAVSVSEGQLSSVASESDFHSSYADDEENSSPLQKFVNLRNRRVRWHDQSSLKNHSSRLKQESLNEVSKDISAGENLETETVPETTTEIASQPTLRPSALVPETAIETAPRRTLLPSAACNRRTSIWQSSRSRAASRRFSVAPGKLLAKPRMDSLGFRGLHGILAPPTSELDDFYSKLGETIENQSTASIAADASFKITARDVVLQKCGQDEPVPFDKIFSEKYLSKCRKIGEGLYGEVFMWEADGQSSVLKIIPIDGDEMINGERQKTFDEILSEIVITKELSELRHPGPEGGSEDLTSGFVEVKQTACVRGKYPPQLLQLWQDFADESGTENDDPVVFSETQLFIVLELANGGADLEKFKFNNSSQALSIFLQTAYALAAAERRIEFEHRDLHWGNVLVSKTDVKHLNIVLNGNDYKVATNGVQVSIIDFTLSRMTYDGCCIYNDLSQDDSLFVSEGDYQFDVYRLMKKNCRNNWQEFVPANNIVWLHYIVDKMLLGVHYLRTTSKVHRDNLKKLSSFKKSLLEFKSTTDFVESL